MCEINPKHTKIFRLEMFTSHEISDEEWEQLAAEKALAMEQLGNMDGRVRVHVHEVPAKTLHHGDNADCPTVRDGLADRCPGHEVYE